MECPVGLLLDAWDGLDGVEQVFALNGILDVGVDEQRVCLRVDVLPVERRTTMSFMMERSRARNTKKVESRSRV